MLRVLKVIVYIVSFIVNITTRLFKVKNNRVVFISYFMNEPEGNYKAIADKLAESGQYEIKFLLKKYSKTTASKMAYFLNMIKQAYYFNTSKIIILDANCVVMKAIIRKRKTVVLQIWHASGAFKKFGQDTKNRLYKVKSCDYAIASSKKVSAIYSRALNIPDKNVFSLGSPRTDALFDNKKVMAYREKIYKKYSIPPGKKLLLYAPTFRGDGIDQSYSLNINFSQLVLGLSDDYVLGVRLHPMVSYDLKADNVIDLKDEDLIETLSATDVLITDYSSIIFEYSILERPMIFYAPDLEQYIDSRDFYMDYREFVPGKITKTLRELHKAIEDKTAEYDKIRKVKQEYFDYHDGLTTERVANFIGLLKESTTGAQTAYLKKWGIDWEQDADVADKHKAMSFGDSA